MLFSTEHQCHQRFIMIKQQRQVFRQRVGFGNETSLLDHGLYAILHVGTPGWPQIDSEVAVNCCLGEVHLTDVNEIVRCRVCLIEDL